MIDFNDSSTSKSNIAKETFLRLEGKPFLLNDWLDVVFIHFALDKDVLQPFVPFPLDLHHRQAYVDLVAFDMKGLRLSRAETITRLLFAPAGSHGFLNVRTYVKYGDEKGIYFLTEWLPNFLSVLAGPPFWGLPFNTGKLNYSINQKTGNLSGKVTPKTTKGALQWNATWDKDITYSACCSGSMEEFLMERYTAFTQRGKHRRYFRIWHEPWKSVPLDLTLQDTSAVAALGDWFQSADYAGAHYSPGFQSVWMGPPRNINTLPQQVRLKPLRNDQGVVPWKVLSEDNGKAKLEASS